MKKALGLCCAILVLWVGTVACADTIHPLFVEAKSVFATLVIDDNGNATCRGSIAARRNNTTIDITLTLEKSSNGKVWSSVKSWNDSGNGILGVSIEETCTVSEGYQYKVVVSGKIYDSAGRFLESISQTSAIKSY